MYCLSFIKMFPAVFIFSTAMKQTFRCASLWCIFSTFYESASNTWFIYSMYQYFGSFLYPPQGAELLHQKRCSAQHCNDCATFLNICLYRANASHLSVRKDNKSKDNPVLMKLKVISSKPVKHNMHGPSVASRVSFSQALPTAAGSKVYLSSNLKK